MNWPDNLVLVDVVIGFTVAEGLSLSAWHLVTGRGPGHGDIAACLLPGLCLLLAMHTLATPRVSAGIGSPASAAWLLAAGAAHAIDLIRRWPSRQPTPR